MSDARVNPRSTSFWRSLAGAVLATAALNLGGCAAMYVDANLKEVPSAAFSRPAVPKPTQLLFEFKTNGTHNARATEALKARVIAQVRDSGLFESVGDTPAAGGALLSLVVNNVALTDDAARKGFVTGLTFGLAGSHVTDGYVCTAQYSPAANAAAASKEVRHAIHTTIGNASPPANAVKADNPEAAVTQMLRQAISHLLNEVSRDAAFQR